MNKFYVYQYRLISSNVPFYVGKGMAGRAYYKTGRNSIFKELISKNNYIVEFIKTNISETEAFLLEIETITSYRKLGGCVANITAGGQGWSGQKHSLETKRRISNSRRGKHMGSRPNYVGKLISEAKKGKVFSTYHKKNLSTAAKLRSANRCKQIIDIVNGFVWSSVKEAAASINMNRKTLCSNLNSNKVNSTNFRYVEVF